MKNILITTFEYPPKIGGAGTFSYRLAKGLSDLGNKVSVLTFSFNDEKFEKEFDAKNNWITHRISSSKYKLWFIHGFLNINKLIRNNCYDKIIIANYTSLLCFQYLNKKLINKLKYDIVFHGNDFEYLKDKKILRDKILIINNRLKFLLDNSNSHIAVSDYLKNMMVVYGYEKDKLKVIHHGIELQLESLAIKPKANKQKLLCVTRLEKGKGLKDLIKSIQYFSENINKYIELTIIGKGSLESELNHYIESNNLNNSINIINNLSVDEVQKFYQTSNLFILLSEKETFGIVIIESMNNRCPVLSTENGSVKEIITKGENGFILTETSVENIAKNIYSILNNPNIESIKNNGVQTIKERFSLTVMAKKYETI
mgnify:CR=1 FL=1